MDRSVKEYLAQIGKKGGQKSRRSLSSEEASMMVRVREAKRAFKNNYTRCFWSYDPNYKITKNDVKWVGETLLKHGGHDLWEIGKKLCR